MKLQNLVVVLLRLMALNFALQALAGLVPWAVVLLGRNPLARDFSVILAGVLELGASTVSAVLLWVLAFPISLRVTKGLSPDPTLGAWSLGDGYSLVFTGIGLFYAVRSLPQVVTWAIYSFKLAVTSPGAFRQATVSWNSVAPPFLLFLAAMLLFWNGRRWGVALAGRWNGNDLPPEDAEATEEGEPSV